MSTERQTKKKKGIAQTSELISWKQKKIIADKEEEEIGKEVQELIKWTSLIESMNDQQLKEYLRNRPEHMQSESAVKIPKPSPGKKVQRNRKPKASLMDAIWKFHREDEETVQIPH
ncbi:hypothetical protein FRX31_019139 [Thalictrum thalictroides]|uniref:Uncharacterized protein n=1 Tax=Thalictrum thalictroides TaxID=46969 RepID=A0A7J6W430_THATH|nr:hypothetical protein FRX31_019139 [Thalictrum thalictroides]